MIQVAIFKDPCGSEINKWLKDHPDHKVIDIKYQSAGAGHMDEYWFHTYAMVIYEDYLRTENTEE